MLYCLTGETPCVANEITSDDISGAIPAGVSEALRHTISEAMEASARARTQSVRAMVGNLGGEMPEPAAGAVNVGSGGGNASGGKETVVIAGGGSGSVRQGRPRRRVYAVANIMAALVAVAVIINAAIIAFGGDRDPGWYYWTRTESEYDSANAWSVGMNDGTVGYTYKPVPYRVRAVAPVPVSSAI